MKIRSKRLNIFPIIIILYSHRTPFRELKITSNTYYLILFVVSETKSILSSQKNREVLKEKGGHLS